MALRWTSAAVCEAAKGFPQAQSSQTIPALRAVAALLATHASSKLDESAIAA